MSTDLVVRDAVEVLQRTNMARDWQAVEELRGTVVTLLSLIAARDCTCVPWGHIHDWVTDPMCPAHGTIAARQVPA